MNAHRRLLLVLTLVVVLGHVLVLDGAFWPAISPGAQPAEPTVFQVRTVMPAASVSRPAEPATPPKARPAVRAESKASPPKPLAADASELALAQASPSPEGITASGEPASNSPTSTATEPAEPEQTALATSSASAPTEADPPAQAAPSPRVTQTSSLPPVVLPKAHTLFYNLQGQAKGFGYSAKGELLWLPAGERYEARLEISAFLLGSRVQTSRGDLTAHGLQPRRFSDKVRSEVAAHMDNEQGRVIFSANTPPVDLLAGAQDHLSAFIQLAGMLGADLGRYLPDGEIVLQAVGPRDADMWRVQVVGEETIDLPVGRMRTIKLVRPPVKPFDLNAELWMAPSLGYLPARIRLTQHNGDFIDQQLRLSQSP